MAREARHFVDEAVLLFLVNVKQNFQESCSILSVNRTMLQGVPFLVFSQLLGCYLKPILWYFTTYLAPSIIRVNRKTRTKAQPGARRSLLDVVISN